jgi:uncharacterized protein
MYYFRFMNPHHLSLSRLQEFFREEKIFGRYGLQRIGIFGSFARGENFNDIDLLIEEPMSLEGAYQLKTELEEKLKIKVDVILKNYAEPIILYRALKDIRYAAAA